LKSLANNFPVRKDKINVGVSVIIFNRKKEVLLYQRKDLGWWGFPGGRVDSEEGLEAAALREVKEEAGLEVVLKNISGIYLKTKGKKNLLFVFKAELKGGKLLKVGDETKDNRWLTIKKAKPLLPPNLRRRLEDVLKNNNFFIRRQDNITLKMWLDLKKRDLKNLFSLR